ncbi:MAG: sigma-54-dependent Fis family transcriptional regulator, partial [Rhodoferax sp.]|nr:sigma-54-dependent Fis family transcriptional regulator [Rhodoferax sp.]
AQAPIPMASQSLHTLLDHCAELLGVSAPVMALARDFLAETGTVMVLTDPRGIVLNMEGDSSTLDAAENLHLIAGADWSESSCGTNAIGTTLAIGQPVQIHSAEHYCEGIKRWSCSATVIRDPLDGSTLGALDVSGLNNSYGRHTLALVVSTAARIESQLAKSELDIRYSLLEACVSRISDSTGDGVILFDRRGRAIKANGKATQILAELEGLSGSPSSARLAEFRIANNGVPIQLPAWASGEFLEPVVINGREVGTLLTLPNRRQRSSGTSWSIPVPVAVPADKSFERIIGQSEVIWQTIFRARQLAKSQVPVLLTGETGVGKEVFARGIHEAHADKSAPFIALNCGGFSRELLTSELFGHVEGSFTGAKRGGMIGKIEAANGGTLFLDEIGEMPIDLQPYFLRVLEEGEVYRLGETKPRKVNFRLIAATHRDLRKEIRNGNFRMDLFYRISVTSVNIPPLRERPQDIPLLVDHYLKLLSRQHGIDHVTMSSGVIKRLMNYDWPGNIRELKNAVECMLLTSQSSVISEFDLPPEILGYGIETTSSLGDEGQHGNDFTRFKQAERTALLNAIRQCKGNVSAVARHLGVAKSTVYLMLKRFDLEGMVSASRHTTTTTPL